jgi:hypothetical protein
LICVLNSDDWLHADAAETAVDRIGQVEVPTILLTGATARRDEPGNDQPSVILEWHPAVVHPGCYFMCANDCHNAIYATRFAYERSGPYDATYGIAADFKWIMTCLESQIGFVYTQDTTVNYVLGGVSSDSVRHGLECLRVMRERFPSLTYDEACTLHDCFFVFGSPASASGRPSDPFNALTHVLKRHSDDPQLVQAIAWALLMHSGRHTDRRDEREEIPASARATMKELVKVALRDHPTVFRAVGRLYAGMRRR